MQAAGWRVKLRAFECFAKHCCSTPAPCDHRTAQSFLHHAIDAVAAPSVPPEMQHAALHAIAGIHSFAPREVALAVRDHDDGQGLGSHSNLQPLVSTVVPSIADDIDALAHRQSSGTAALRRGSSAAQHTAGTAAAEPAAGARLQSSTVAAGTRQPLECIANSAAGAASQSAGSGPRTGHDASDGQANGLGGASKAQLQALLDVIDAQPMDCNAAIKQLTRAALELPADVWQV